MFSHACLAKARQCHVDSSCLDLFLQKQKCASPTSHDEHGEEDHGAASAGGVQPAGQCPGPDAPPQALHRAVPPSEAHDPEGAGGEAVHDAASVQQGESSFQDGWCHWHLMVGGRPQVNSRLHQTCFVS